MKDTTSVIKIYKDAFGSSEPFDSLLFGFFGDCIHTVSDEGGNAVSMLFKIPCTILKDGAETKAYYIYAAATDVKHRRQGYMTKLLSGVAGDADAPVFLKPASKELAAFYEHLGFTPLASGRGGDAIIKVCEKQEQLSVYCESCSEDYILMFSKLPKGVKKAEFLYPMD